MEKPAIDLQTVNRRWNSNENSAAELFQTGPIRFLNSGWKNRNLRRRLKNCLARLVVLELAAAERKLSERKTDCLNENERKQRSRVLLPNVFAYSFRDTAYRSQDREPRF